MADLKFATNSGDYTALSGASVEGFRDSLNGESLLPGDEGYDDARRIWNAMVDKRPALIARCSGTADVIKSVNFARERDLLISVRGGGHNFPGNSVCNDGLMIDLSRMTGVRVDPAAKTVRAQGGTKWGAFDHETQAFGLAAPGGTDVDTGIAGLTLGGGIGWLSGSYGLSCDNMIAADVVTADGRMLTASADENPDLLWALRGRRRQLRRRHLSRIPIASRWSGGAGGLPGVPLPQGQGILRPGRRVCQQYARRNEPRHLPDHPPGW